MAPALGWQEVESEIYWPNTWVGLAVGSFFLLTGVVGLFKIEEVTGPGLPLGIGVVGATVFAFMGGVVCFATLGRIIASGRVRHATPDILPNVPADPVILEGSISHGRVTHELVEDADCWQFCPAPQLWRDAKRFLLGFGIPFLTFFAGMASWIAHREFTPGRWPVSILLGTSITVFCGGSTFLLGGTLIRSGYRRLSSLKIPKNGDDLELDSPKGFAPASLNLPPGLGWSAQANGEHCLRIRRELLKAVQLCPWKFVVQRTEISYAVQGLLVLGCSDESEYCRLPILLTSDVGGAARLMQRLAATLEVPYLVNVDARAFQAESIRAKSRQPLRGGGTL
jgi:hypothetical protein